MAFLDNSGDIILDAVLTDTGRMRLARGDGSFRIAKFALGDDEIDYSSYNKAHASGSAYYDLQILQTPVFEAFTNNTSTMKTKLVSIPRTSLLYLPEIALNTKINPFYSTSPNQNVYLVAVDLDTEVQTILTNVDGVINGFSVNKPRAFIQCDQGLNTTELTNTETVSGDLFETQYIIEMDNRLGAVYSNNGKRAARVSFIDDDNVASYYLSYNTNNPRFVSDLIKAGETGQETDAVIAGPKGSMLKFTIKASTDLTSNNFLFTKLGGTVNVSSVSHRYIDSTIRVTGATTGYRVDIPLRFIKKV